MNIEKFKKKVKEKEMLLNRNVFKPTEGTNTIRLLPLIDVDDDFAIEYPIHYLDNKTIPCMGEDCLICKVAKYLFKINRDIASSIYKKYSYWVDVYIREQNMVKPFRFGIKLYLLIRDAILNLNSNVVDVKNGRDLVLIKRTIVVNNQAIPNYDSSFFKDPSPLAPTDVEIKTILSKRVVTKDFLRNYYTKYEVGEISYSIIDYLATTGLDNNVINKVMNLLEMLVDKREERQIERPAEEKGLETQTDTIQETKEENNIHNESSSSSLSTPISTSTPQLSDEINDELDISLEDLL